MKRRTPMKRGPSKRKPTRTKSRRPAKKRPKKSTLQKKCDDVFSILIRHRDRVCITCGSGDTLQCSHHLSRRYLIIRYDFDNACAHCARCHTRFTYNPADHVLWIIETYGMDHLLMLREKRDQGTREKYRPDYVAIHARLSAQLKEVEAA